MDRNSIIGLSLIAVLLFGYTYLSQPSAEEIKKQEKAKKELAEEKKKESAKRAKEKTANLDTKKSVEDSTKTTAGNTGNDNPEPKVQLPAFKEEILDMTSDQLIVSVSTKGGDISTVQLKGFESYDDFAKNDGKKTPLQLFDHKDNTNQLVFTYKGQKYETGDKPFEVVSATKNKIVLEHKLEEGSIRYIYKLNKWYNLDFDIEVNGLAKQVPASSVMLNWKTTMKRTERLVSEQRRVSTICFQNADEKLDWTSEAASDSKAAEQKVNWVAFKQSYFSAILTPDEAFEQKGTTFKINGFTETSKRATSHIKTYNTTLNLGLNSTENSVTSFHWYFGPNDYKTLKSYHKGYDDILNWGWGIFRWINLYAVEPLFTWFLSIGIPAGFAILLLTLVLKLVLMPIQWKMFVSSAKMRILKPETDAINAKYPNPEDRMKKQMDMMALQRESGASPLAGCLPMLLQMPILLAVFRFFPASFGLRQHGFLWAEDLSSYDSIWDFGFNIPVYGDHMSLFTLLMAGTTLAYTYLNSQNVTQQQQPGMPNMKVIMYIFPFMMIFFFNNYSSGLSYYYFISTLMTIVLMFAIKKFFVDEEKLKAKMAASRVKKAGSKGEPKKKSGFMARLEEAQRIQQEQAKNRKKK
jgi:YidC/Oxa1 family membrane protein insertase